MKEPYNRITVNGKRVRAAKVVWNKYYPDDQVKDGEVIHHKDGNKNNDSPENLVKMTDLEHRSFHMKGAKVLKKWRAENPELARKSH